MSSQSQDKQHRIQYNYEVFLKPIFKKALKDALALEGFQKAKFLEDIDCQYLNECGDHSMVEAFSIKPVLDPICQNLENCNPEYDLDFLLPVLLEATISDQGKKPCFVYHILWVFLMDGLVSFFHIGI